MPLLGEQTMTQALSLPAKDDPTERTRHTGAAVLSALLSLALLAAVLMPHGAAAGVCLIGRSTFWENSLFGTAIEIVRRSIPMPALSPLFAGQLVLYFSVCAVVCALLFSLLTTMYCLLFVRGGRVLFLLSAAFALTASIAAESVVVLTANRQEAPLGFDLPLAVSALACLGVLFADALHRRGAGAWVSLLLLCAALSAAAAPAIKGGIFRAVLTRLLAGEIARDDLPYLILNALLLLNLVGCVFGLYRAVGIFALLRFGVQAAGVCALFGITILNEGTLGVLSPMPPILLLLMGSLAALLFAAFFSALRTRR